MHCFTWESFRELSEKNENHIDQIDSILSEISIADEKYQMSLHSKLFPVWIGGHSEIWSHKRKYSGCMEDFKM